MIGAILHYAYWKVKANDDLKLLTTERGSIVSIFTFYQTMGHHPNIAE